MSFVMGACGINCSECSTYKATKANDDAYREQTAQRMREQYKININKEDINCNGCLEQGPHIGYCAVCKIRECVVQNKLDSCAHCNDYPCTHADGFHKNAPHAKANLEALRAEL
jgi:hypothetical protein